MKKNLQLFYVLVLLSSTAFSQQIPHYSQYMYNMQLLNPAYVGVRSDLSFTLLARSQWAGVEGAPETQTFAFQSRAFDGIGIGLSAVHDKLGLAKETALNFDLSYTLVVSEKDRLAFGLKGAMSFYTNNLANGITPDDDVYASTSGIFPNIGMGAFYYNENYYVGLSIPFLLKTPKFRLDNATNITGLSSNLNYFITAGYIFKPINSHFKIKPSVLVKYATNLPLSIDVNINVLYKEKFEMGVSYRNKDAVSALLAFHFNDNFRIGYAYDYTISSFSNYNSGSHEIILMYDLYIVKRGRWLEHSKCYF